MPLLDEIRANKLIELARERFDPVLTDTELKVLRDSARSTDPHVPEENAARPVIRSEFIRWLATDPHAAIEVDPKGLRVYGFTLATTLDLEECANLPALTFARCTIHEVINLRVAQVKGLYLFYCTVEKLLVADGLTVHGPLFLRDLYCPGTIRLPGAHIEGNLDCTGATLTNDDTTLSLEGAYVGGDVFLNDGFESAGPVRLLGIKIGGDLDCSGIKLTGEGQALVLDRAEIHGGVFFHENLTCSGEIRMPGVRIGGNLSCSGATFSSSGDALSLERVHVGGGAYFDKGFACLGTVGLAGATIGGDLAFFGAFAASVVCKNTEVHGDFIWQGIMQPQRACLELIGARVKNLRDDRASWPAADNLLLDGLVYEDLTLHQPPGEEEFASAMYGDELELKASDRIQWLMIQSKDRRREPQPWMQFRDLLEKKGDRRGAKHVLYKLHCVQAQENGPPLRQLKIAFAWLEEVPLRILWSIVLLLAIATGVFSYAGPQGAIAPTDAGAYRAWKAGQPLPSAYPRLNPFIYVLENSLPLVKLGQDDKWAPDRNYLSRIWITSYWFLMWARWILILSGWFQATVLAAALSRRFKE